MKQYKLLKNGETVLSRKKGNYAGWSPGKIFGTLECKSGMRMKPENRVFFATLEDAVKEGYRPCKNCKPLDENDFEQIKHLVPYNTLDEFYNRDNQHA